MEELSRESYLHLNQPSGTNNGSHLDCIIDALACDQRLGLTDIMLGLVVKCGLRFLEARGLRVSTCGPHED